MNKVISIWDDTFKECDQADKAAALYSLSIQFLSALYIHMMEQGKEPFFHQIKEDILIRSDKILMKERESIV